MYVPYQLERLMQFGTLLCLDSFLAIMTIMPYRAAGGMSAGSGGHGGHTLGAARKLQHAQQESRCANCCTLLWLSHRVPNLPG